MGQRTRSALGLGPKPLSGSHFPKLGELWWTIRDGQAHPTLIQSIDREPCRGGYQTVYIMRFKNSSVRFTKEAIEIGLTQGFFVRELPDDWVQGE